MRKYQGFSLIELLIVVAVIVIVAAIAIPNLLAARRSANGGSAVSSLRALHAANASYAATTGGGKYAGMASTVGISSLIDLASAGFIDASLGSGEKGGYSFVGDRTEGSLLEPPTFYFSANPVISSGVLTTGTRRFGVATDAVIRVDASPTNLATVFDAASLMTASPLND